MHHNYLTLLQENITWLYPQNIFTFDSRITFLNITNDINKKNPNSHSLVNNIPHIQAHNFIIFIMAKGLHGKAHLATEVSFIQTLPSLAIYKNYGATNRCIT